MKKSILLTVVLLFSLTALSQSCAGKWVTIDDETGKKKSIVKLYKEDGKLYGKIVYLFPREGRPDNAKCDLCEDDRKDQPLLGLQIVRDLSWDGSVWEDGTIVDPAKGKIYNCKLWLEEDDKLKLRGYAGPFYRTQTWLRVPED